jgi:uncharacterized protein HemY
LGNVTAAHEHLQTGLALADARSLSVTYQWLFSTGGEIALAEKDWEAAASWFRRGLPEAERNNNAEMLATYRANLGLAAWGRAALDDALAWLTHARAAAPDSYQRIQVDLWLTELHLDRGEPASARATLERAEASLVDHERQGLKSRAEGLRARLENQ